MLLVTLSPLGAGNSQSQAGWRRKGKKTWVVNAGVKHQKSFLLPYGTKGRDLARTEQCVCCCPHIQKIGVFTVQVLQHQIVLSGRCGAGSAGVVLNPEARSGVSRCYDCGFFGNLSFKVSKPPEPRRRM